MARLREIRAEIAVRNETRLGNTPNWEDFAGKEKSAERHAVGLMNNLSRMPEGAERERWALFRRG